MFVIARHQIKLVSTVVAHLLSLVLGITLLWTEEPKADLSKVLLPGGVLILLSTHSCYFAVQHV